mmetsp:Transcript_3533/g.9749  ORF Transcript_3533/g.9749 Transcript_3533/m.9749 type:complete len:81 (+) Transcript_3533:1059-1301(+)
MHSLSVGLDCEYFSVAFESGQIKGGCSRNELMNRWGYEKRCVALSHVRYENFREDGIGTGRFDFHISHPRVVWLTKKTTK